MKSRIGVNVGKCSLQIDQFQGRPSPKYARAAASKNRRRFASRAICLPNTLEQARLARTVRTSRLGRQSVMTGAVVVARSSTVASRDELECGAATDKASLSAISATCTGSQKHSGGSGCGSSSNVLRWARIKQALLVSRQPSPVPCTPGPCPGSRVRIRPPSHSTTARFGGASGCRARAPSPLGSLSRRWASSQPMSWTTRSIVLAETGWSPALRITRAARSNDRVSAAVTAIFLTSKGVNARASRPRTSRRGKKRDSSPISTSVQKGNSRRSAAESRAGRGRPEIMPWESAGTLRRTPKTAVNSLFQYSLRQNHGGDQREVSKLDPLRNGGPMSSSPSSPERRDEVEDLAQAIREAIDDEISEL